MKICPPRVEQMNMGLKKGAVTVKYFNQKIRAKVARIQLLEIKKIVKKTF